MVHIYAWCVTIQVIRITFSYLRALFHITSLSIPIICIVSSWYNKKYIYSKEKEVATAGVKRWGLFCFNVRSVFSFHLFLLVRVSISFSFPFTIVICQTTTKSSIFSWFAIRCFKYFVHAYLMSITRTTIFNGQSHIHTVWHVFIRK